MRIIRHLTLIAIIFVVANVAFAGPSEQELSQSHIKTLNAIKAAGKTVSCAAIDGLKDLEHIANLNIEVTEVNVKKGYVLGKADFMDYTINEVCLMSVKGFDGRPHWMVCFKFPSFSFAQFFSSAKEGDFLDGILRVPHVIFALAKDDQTVAARDMPDPVKKFFGGIYNEKDFNVSFAAGINLFVPVNLAVANKLGKFLRIIGFQATEIVLRASLDLPLGLIWGGAKGEHKKENQEKWTKRKRTAMGGLALQAVLPPYRFPVISPKFLKAGQPILEITGKPSISAEFHLTTSFFNDDVEWIAGARVQGDIESLTATATLYGKQEGDWNNPFGIEELTIHNSVIKICFDALRETIDVGVGGYVQMGSKEIKLALKIDWGIETEVPEGAIFYGSVNEITLTDLVNFANLMGTDDSTSSQQEPPPPVFSTDGLPDISLNNVKLKFASEADTDLNILPGLQIDGEIQVEGKEFCSAGAYLGLGGLDVTKGLSGFKIHGDIKQIGFGCVCLKDAALEIDIPMGIPKFHIQGNADLLGTKSELLIDVSKSGYTFHAKKKLFNLFMVELDAKAPISSDPDWFVRAKMKNDFNRFLEKKIFGQAAELARKAKDGIDKAKHGTDVAYHKVRQLEGSVDKMRTEVAKERLEALNKVKQAQRKVSKWNHDISNMRRTVNKQRQQGLKKLKAARRDHDHAWHQFHYEKHWSMHGKVWKRPGHASKAAYWWGRAQTEDKILPKIIKTWGWAEKHASIDADPRIIALKARQTGAKKLLQAANAACKFAKTHVPLDVDPRIVGMVASLKAAEAGLLAANRILDAAEKAAGVGAVISDFMAKATGQLIVVEEAGFNVALKELINTGKTGDFHLKVIFMGDEMTFNYSIDFRRLEYCVEQLGKHIIEMAHHKHQGRRVPSNYGPNKSKVSPTVAKYQKIANALESKDLASSLTKKLQPIVIHFFKRFALPFGGGGSVPHGVKVLDFWKVSRNFLHSKLAKTSLPMIRRIASLNRNQLAWLNGQMKKQKLSWKSPLPKLKAAIGWASKKKARYPKIPAKYQGKTNVRENV